ncbi:hypothetical protein [Actinoplanes regularis]|uniref:SMI1/KNR4 family protein n=1 Tax=Actinoplanes regularis TaxID=52697 RepID=A0A239BS75_9ACTN|nr:hypothetical protein [Actinoplanes regularis]SNS10905.1 hypothetical protein SAMN06264365_110109 [Actinoplanes regularis]
MTTIASLRDKLETLRVLEAERGFGNVVVPGAPLAPVDGLPPGTTEVFSLFARLEGVNFLFKPPWDLRTPEAWRSRLTDDFPLGENLQVGAEIVSMPEHLPGDTEEIEDRVGYGGASVMMRVADGHVIYIDPEDYIGAYDDPDPSHTEIVIFAPDLATFFDEYVLGEKYPRLVDVVLGTGTADRRHPRTGEYVDSWRRLLIAAGLLGCP